MDLGEKMSLGFNHQVQTEYEAFYEYENMAAHFSQPTVGLLGFAKFFKEAANEEIEHARTFIKFLNKRGSRVELQHIMLTLGQLSDKKDGVLTAIRQAINIENKVTEKIKQLHLQASNIGDAHTQHFLDDFLEEQVNSMVKLTVMKSRLELDDSSIFLLDQELYK